MAELPTLDDAKETATKVVSETRSALPFLLDEPYYCDDCGDACEASRAYDPQRAAWFAETNGRAPSWYCRNCDQHYQRIE
jgi:hypothetical protein